MYSVANYFNQIYNLQTSENIKKNVVSDLGKGKEKYIAPETEIEKTVCKIWCQVFNVNENTIGRMDDFMELGGDSLNAFKILSMIEKEFKIKLSLKDIFSYSLIYSLSKYIEDILNHRIDFNLYKLEIIEKKDCKEFPITSQQLDIYNESMKNKNSIIFNVPFSFKLNKTVNIEKVIESFNKLFHNHEIFRSKYYEKKENNQNEIFGCIDDNCSLIFENYTYENVKSFIRPFDLSQAPLIRVGFIKNEMLLIDMHHIICDEMSISFMINELNSYYKGIELKDSEIQFSDYAIHLNKKKSHGCYENQIKFYKEMFDCEYDLLNLPKKEQVLNQNEINEEENESIGISNQNIDKYISNSINKFIVTNKISKTAFFLSIYGYVLSKYSGQDIIYSSILSANRSNHYINNMAGMFTCIQPILLKYENSEISFLDIIKQNMNILINSYSSSNISFSELSNLLKLSYSKNSFIYQPRLMMNNTDNLLFVINKEREDIFSMNTNNIDDMSNNDLLFSVIENEDNYSVLIKFNTNVYEPRIINSILNSYIEVLKNINKFDHTIKDIEYISSEEKERIIETFNNNSYEFDYNQMYHEKFMKLAEKYPDKCAIVDNDIKISFKELDEMSNSLAHYLRGAGITRNDIIPIICDRTYHYIVGIIGISKAGAAFLPVDRKLPAERIQFLVEDSNPKMILYYNTKDIIDNFTNKTYKTYDLEVHDYNANRNPIKLINDPSDICYVLFTSGTTGKPKGVLVRHANLYNYVRAFDEENKNYSIYSLFKKDNINNILGITNFAFDTYHNEITISLIHGFTIVMVNDNLTEDVPLLAKYILKNNIDYINITPTRFKLFMENEEFRQSLKIVKAIIFIGEPLPISLCKNIHQYSKCIIYNGYGPTECTNICTVKEVNEEKEKKITIGKPLCNCKLYILDKYLKPVPVGVEGEIFIGGFGVSKGYFNRDELTKEKFIPCPFNKNSKCNEIMYRTGDLGKWTENGEIEHLGRMDFQIKINGQRIELGEIESTVNEIREIENSFIIDKVKETGEKYLICYYISQSNIQGKEIREFLKKKLPRYMIPNYYKQIYEIPLSPTGKLNKKVLPEINVEDLIKEKYIPPETKIEKIICKIYSELFKINENEIGKVSDFYDLGGDSLNAIRVSSMIEKELNIKIYIKDILTYSIVCNLASFIEKIISNKKSECQIETIKKRNSKEFPVTSQQLGVYIDSIKNENSIIYNVPSSFKLNKNSNVEKIKDAFQKIFQNHEILRSKYCEKEVNGKAEIYGFIDDECTLSFENYTYENVNTFVRPFKLPEAPLIRIGFINDEMVLIDMHHIICDGATISIITNELNNYYNDKEVQKLEIQFSDYAIDLNEKKNSGYYNNQIEFYKKMFNYDYNLLNIPQKKDKIVNSSEDEREKDVNAGNLTKSIDSSTSKFIDEYIKTNGISKTAFFISIYGYVLSKYSGQNLIYSSVISANRYNRYTESMVGMFASTQPILLKYDNEENTFLDIIKQNKNILVDIYNNQDLSFSELSSSLKLVNVNNSFVYQPKTIVENSIENTLFSENDNEDIFLTSDNQNELNKNNTSKFDISLNVFEKNDNYSFSIDYNTNLYELKMINNILDSYLEVIKNCRYFNQKVNDIEYIPKKEKERIIDGFNSDVNDYQCEPFCHVEFCNKAKQHPNKCALVFNDTKFSYDKLDKMSNSLAHYLRNSGITRNDIVPIISERSFYYIIATIAISKAGGAYLPVDKKLPIDRIQFILEEVHPKLILLYDNQNNFENLLKDKYQIYDLEKHDYSLSIDPIDNINEPDDTSYVLFTSGTTGKPKGTLVSHFNIYNYVRAFEEGSKNHCIYNLFIKRNNIQNVLAITNFSFDASHIENTISLVHGLKLVLADDNVCNDLVLLSKYMIENDVDYINTTPTRLKLFMENEDFRKALKMVKTIVLGGEELTFDLCKEVHKYSESKIYNGYGPTECAVDGTFKAVDEEKDSIITIGQPLCNCKLYILDKFLKPVPIGVDGEIFIGGYGVGKGYLNRTELTNEKFINCPFSNENKHNKIMYRTGDLGKWTDNGEIEYLGRIDFQVKIHGQRIELGEIDNTIKEIKDIEYSVVIDKVKKTGDKYLICYYMSQNEISGKKIRNYLKTKLPMYMIPNYFIRINEVPITPNGKLDRRALPEPKMEDLIQEQYIAPETEIEKTICKIFSEIFKINENEIGRMSDFYELGGDSLSAIKVVAKLKKIVNTKLTIKDIMKIVSSLELNIATYSYYGLDDLYSTIADDFNAYSEANNLDIHLNVNSYSENREFINDVDYASTVETLMKKKNQKHDLYVYNPAYLKRYFPYLLDLQELLPKSHIDLYSSSTGYQLGFYDNKLVGIPLFLQFMVLYSSKLYLDKYKKEIPKTWNELIETAEYILNQESLLYNNTSLIGYNGFFSKDENTMCSLYGYIYSYRETKDSPFPDLNSKTAIESLKKLIEIRDRISSSKDYYLFLF
ncbi:acetyl-CoA synthetase-like protein [Anaeromyces robustus]|uniref:Acetyl-CoA synthetase-like protein n=1 Tax=Anaeromyces robustus TaxID=1754192 RepID=A0A1Y1X929_9FUNG|nr:acetyl-CoA synthetase-like protein [Anaeromyces robustus]|eukprot:ORX81926.1 acetyl-CoA synthetase-like protein [Anaeromyces robustus]